MKRFDKGFTLVEVLVATAVTGILILVIMSFFVNSLVAFTINSARGDLLRDAQLSLDSITQELRLSSNSYEGASLLDENAPAEGWLSDNDTLVVATAAVDSANNILFADMFHYTSHKNNTIYYLDGTDLKRRIIAIDVPNNAQRTSCPENVSSLICPADAVLAENVRQFNVKYFSGDNVEVTPDEARSIEITLELAKTQYGRELDAKYVTRTVFRNE